MTLLCKPSRRGWMGLAALFAVLFSLASVVHTAAHAFPASSPDPACAVCSAVPEIAATATPGPPAYFPAMRLAAVPTNGREAGVPAAHRSRAPPSG